MADTSTSQIIGYRRVSSIDQKLDRQDLPDVTGKVFEEKVSGKNTSDRPSLKAMIGLTDIADRKVRDLVLYNLRHFMITQRIMSGLTFRQIADMCGTSVAQIEKTYYHLNDEICLTNVGAEYRRREDGTIEVL